MGDLDQRFIQKIVKFSINDVEVVAKTAEYLLKIGLVYCTRSNTQNNFFVYLNGPANTLATGVRWAQDKFNTALEKKVTYIAIDINSYLLDFEEGDDYVDEPTMSLVSFEVFNADLTALVDFVDRASELLRPYNLAEVKLILSNANGLEHSNPTFNYYENKLYKLVWATIDYDEQKKMVPGTNDNELDYDELPVNFR